MIKKNHNETYRSVNFILKMFLSWTRINQTHLSWATDDSVPQQPYATFQRHSPERRHFFMLLKTDLSVQTSRTEPWNLAHHSPLTAKSVTHAYILLPHPALCLLARSFNSALNAEGTTHPEPAWPLPHTEQRYRPHRLSPRPPGAADPLLTPLPSPPNPRPGSTAAIVSRAGHRGRNARGRRPPQKANHEPECCGGIPSALPSWPPGAKGAGTASAGGREESGRWARARPLGARRAAVGHEAGGRWARGAERAAAWGAAGVGAPSGRLCSTGRYDRAEGSTGRHGLQGTLKAYPAQACVGRAAIPSSGCPWPHPTRPGAPPRMGHPQLFWEELMAGRCHRHCIWHTTEEGFLVPKFYVKEERWNILWQKRRAKAQKAQGPSAGSSATSEVDELRSCLGTCRHVWWPQEAEPEVLWVGAGLLREAREKSSLWYKPELTASELRTSSRKKERRSKDTSCGCDVQGIPEQLSRAHWSKSNAKGLTLMAILSGHSHQCDRADAAGASRNRSFIFSEHQV